MPTQTAFSTRNYAGPGYENAQPQLDDLFLFISASKVSLVVARKSDGNVSSLRSVDGRGQSFLANVAELRAALDSFNMQKEFGSIRIVIDHIKHIFVPEPLFVGEKAASYLGISMHNDPNDKVVFNRMSQNNMASVFAIHQPVWDFLRQFQPDAILIHQKELFVDMMQGSQYRGEERIFVFVKGDSFDIGFLRNGGLHFLNTFPHEADTDIIYFLLSVMEAFKINAEKSIVMLCGDINPNGSLPGLMKKYIPFAELMKRPARFHYPATFREFPEHQNFLETCCLLCES